MCARLRAIVAAVVLLNLVSALNDIAEADVAHVAQLDEAPQPKVPAPQIKVAPRRKAIRINGDMYIGHDVYIGNRMRLKRKEHMLDWNKGLHSKTLVDNLGYNADFTNFVNGHVSLAHSNGMMIDSQSKAKSGPNARFRNQGMTEVQLASQSGRAIHATSPQGGDWTGFFSNKATTVVKLAGPDGTGLHCETKTGKASAIFVNAKSRVDISTIGGQAIQSSTTGASATWNAQFEANGKSKLVLAHTGGSAIHSSTSEGKVWNAEFHHTKNVELKLAHETGMGIRSYTTSGKTWNAYFGHSGRSVVRLGHPSGMALAAWTFSGEEWNAEFGNGKPTKAQLKLVHHSGAVINSQTNAGLAYNARFTNQDASTVSLSRSDGSGILSVTHKGTSYNTQIQNTVGGVDLSLAGPTGTGIWSKTTKQTKVFNSVFESLSASVKLASGDGTGIQSITEKGKWNMHIQHGKGEHKTSMVQLGGAQGAAIYSHTKCKASAWNGVFVNDGLGRSSVKVSHTDGTAIHSQTSGETNKVFNAIFANMEKAVVSVAHSDGTAIKSTSKASGQFSAQFSNNAASEVKLAHGAGLALSSVSHMGEWNALFQNTKMATLKVGKADGTVFHAVSAGHGWAGIVENPTENVVVSLAGSGGAGISAKSTAGSTQWSGHFSHSKKAEVRIGGPDGTGIYSSALDAGYSGVFESESPDADAQSNVRVSLANRTGVGVVSETIKAEPTIFNSKFSYRNKAEVKLCRANGMAIHATTLEGTDPNAIFAFKGRAQVTVSKPDGQGLDVISYAGTTSAARFQHSKSTRVLVGGSQGNAILSVSESGKTWNSVFATMHGMKPKVQIAHADGRGIHSTTSGGEVSNAAFEYEKKSSIQLADHTGMALRSVTPYHATRATQVSEQQAIAGVYNAEFEHTGRASVKVGHSSGLAIDAKSLSGEGWVAQFTNGKHSLLKIGDAKGTALHAISKGKEWNSVFESPAGVVRLAHAEHEMLQVESTKEADKKHYLISSKNAKHVTFRVRADGQVEIGSATGGGVLVVNGDIHATGTLRTWHNGKVVGVHEMFERVDALEASHTTMLRENKQLRQEQQMMKERFEMLEQKMMRLGL